MKKLLLIVFSVVLLVFLIVPSLIPANENPVTEGTEETELAENSNSTEGTDEIQIDENNTTTEPSETTIQTDGGEDVNDEEYAGSGNPDDFLDQYTIVKPPMSEKRRISVFVDGVDHMADFIDIIDFQTAEGDPVIRHTNRLCILESDTVARQVGTLWQAGDEAAKYYLYDGDYVFTLNMELVDITVEYLNTYYYYTDSRYCEKRFYYELENVTSVRLEVSNFCSKEVRCFLIGPEGETEVFPSELPEEERGLYGDADQ